MQCPNCGCTKLKLAVVFAGEVECSFRDGEVVEILNTASLESRWDNSSTSHCMECGWTGRVKELRSASGRSRPQTQRNRAGECVRLAEVERAVVAGACPSQLEPDVKAMVQRIQQLQKEIQILETVARAKRNGRSLENSDTAIL